MKTRLAVVGSGFGLYGLLPAFQRIPACSIVGICGQTTPRLADYCRQTSVPVFADWKQMIERCQPAALAVAVVPLHQPEIIAYALRRGISVFAEKPLAVELAQAQQLLEMTREKNVAHIVDFLFPELPEWRRTRELLAQGVIGKISRVTVEWRFLSHDIKNGILSWKTIPSQGGGALSFYFCHAFYNLEFFLGKIARLESRLAYSPQSPGGGETGVELSLQFENGCQGEIRFDCASPLGHCHAWRFGGDSGSVILSNSSPSFARGFQITHQGQRGGSQTVPVAPMALEEGLDERVPLVQSLGRRFIDWQKGLTPARPDFADGVRVQHLIERTRQSFERKQTLTV